MSQIANMCARGVRGVLVNQVAKVCVRGASGATACSTAPAWATVAIVGIVTVGAVVILTHKYKQGRLA